MNWNMPLSVDIDGKAYNIRNKCDYRMVLDCIAALNDQELDMSYRVECALIIFYEDFNNTQDLSKLTEAQLEIAIKEMMQIIGNGEDETEHAEESKPKVMDWEHDFKYIAPPISRVLGYSVRDENKYTHWYDFIGAYMEIGECVFANIISIRNKKVKGQKLEKYEQEFYREHKKAVDLPLCLTDEEREWLDSDW